MHIITISERRGRWTITGPDKRGRQFSRDDSWNAGDAAAKALNWAMNVGAPYCIVGHNEAMKLIPAEVRSKLG